MASICTAVPLKPGMWDVIKKYRDELVKQLDHADVAHARDNRGFKTVKIWHQNTPVEALILYFEADDLEEAFHPKHQADEASAKWTAFWANVGGLKGRLLEEFPQMMIDWHHEDGHQHTAEVRAPAA